MATASAPSMTAPLTTHNTVHIDVPVNRDTWKNSSDGEYQGSLLRDSTNVPLRTMQGWTFSERLSMYKDLKDFTNPAVYNAAFFEFIGTFLYYWCYVNIVLSAQINSSYIPYYTQYGIGLIILNTLFIYAFCDKSGAHFNPLITWTTFFTGFTSLPRLVLYVVAQTFGVLISGGIMTKMLDHNPNTLKQLACSYSGLELLPDDDIFISSGAAAANEIFFSFLFMLIIYSVTFDDKKKPLLGAIWIPIVIGFAQALFSATTMYPATSANIIGTVLNPVVCVAPWIYNRYNNQSMTFPVFILAPLVGGWVFAFMFNRFFPKVKVE
jgi:glycerol uptake facilitator-like aquaporin